MQIYAINEKGHTVHALEALRNHEYYCLECGSPLRLRGGSLRRLHFYHLNSFHACRLNGKSYAHLQIQHSIQKWLAPEQVAMEHYFPEIGRIADIAWTSRKIIFEVQCSPISAEEVQARNNDYSTIGYTVVWILHDKRFNRFRLSQAELFLQNSPHYFSNVSNIYDQYALIKGGRRIKRTPRMPILINRPEFNRQPQLPKERRAWPLSFFGDLTHQPYPLLVYSKKNRGTYSFLSPIRALFHYFLENTTN